MSKMIRVHDNFAAVMLGALSYLRQAGITPRHIVDSMLRSPSTLTPAQGRDFAESITFKLDSEEGQDPDLSSLQAMMELLAAQLVVHVHGDPTEGDLIDQVVSMLQLGFGANRFTPKSLMALRKAILLPGELRKLTEHNDMSCSSCNHTFTDAEMVVYSSHSNGKIQCSRCRKPVYRACDKCEERYVQLPALTRKHLEREADCGADHSAKPAASGQRPGEGYVTDDGAPGPWVPASQPRPRPEARRGNPFRGIGNLNGAAPAATTVGRGGGGGPVHTWAATRGDAVRMVEDRPLVETVPSTVAVGTDTSAYPDPFTDDGDDDDS